MLGMFVREPEMQSTIDHLSGDDRVALCGRSVDDMICVGEVEDDSAYEPQSTRRPLRNRRKTLRTRRSQR